MVRPNGLRLVVHTSRDLVADPHASAEVGDVGPAATATRLDVVALGAAFEREAPVLLAAARAITFDERESEDLVQTTFELAIRHLGALRDPNALRPGSSRSRLARHSGLSAACGGNSGCAPAATSSRSLRGWQRQPTASPFARRSADCLQGCERPWSSITWQE